jgi:hypothetical protein
MTYSQTPENTTAPATTQRKYRTPAVIRQYSKKLAHLRGMASTGLVQNNPKLSAEVEAARLAVLRARDQARIRHAEDSIAATLKEVPLAIPGDTQKAATPASDNQTAQA